MKTIEKLLRYKFNRKQRRYLQAQGYMNGCGGKGGFNFSRTITDIIEELHGFQKDFYKKLLLDLEKLCGEHDIDFTLGGTKWDFRKANFIFAYKVFKLTSWNKWRHIFGRIGLMLIIYILLNRHGKYYFNFKSKKTLEDLFKNYKESNEKNY